MVREGGREGWRGMEGEGGREGGREGGSDSDREQVSQMLKNVHTYQHAYMYVGIDTSFIKGNSAVHCPPIQCPPSLPPSLPRSVCTSNTLKCGRRLH